MEIKTKEHAKPGSTKRIELRRPVLQDGSSLWNLARESGTLDLNSPYAYLMWCDQFAESSMLAEVDGRPAGFVLGFRPPEREHVLFVWQVAVADEYRGLGIATRMLGALVDRSEVRAVEASVTPSNTASQNLFRALARRSGCSCREEPYIEAEHFPDSEHEPEVLFHIGPIPGDQYDRSER